MSSTPLNVSPILWPKNKLRLLVIGTCNAHCPHCNNEGVAKNTRPMPLWLVNVIASTAKAVGQFPQTTTISGGEPLLHPEIQSLLTIVSEISRSITVSTNAFLLDAPTARALASVGVTKVRIDLDPWRFDRPGGAKHTLNTTRVAERVSLIREAGMAVAFNTVLTSYTPAQLRDLLQFSQSLSVNTKCFECLRRDPDSHKYVAAPDVPFAHLETALGQAFPLTGWIPNRVAGGDRTANCPGFTLRYCGALCSAGACFYSGLRCEPLGHLSTCINGFNSLSISDEDSVSKVTEKIHQANLRGCCL